MWVLTNEEFSGLMRQYQRLVYTVCYQFVKNPHTAEDLTQDTFLAAYSAIDRCEPQYYKQWLVRVAANKCKDYLKSAWVRKVEMPGDEALPESPQPRGDPAALVGEKTAANELTTLIESLREPYGRVAVLYFLRQQPVAEIAKALNRPPATVQNQIFRAKALLRRQLTGREKP